MHARFPMFGFGCPTLYARGLQSFSAEGHIDDFLRFGGPNVKKFDLPKIW